jgi:CheY-like chemotaxis protein
MFSVIFMDISMPVMDGYEATRAIRVFEDQVLKSFEKLTYIVGLTAHATDIYKQQCFDSGMDEFSKNRNQCIL